MNIRVIVVTFQHSARNRRRSRVRGIGARRDDIELRRGKPRENRKGQRCIDDRRIDDYFNQLLKEDIND